MRRFIFPLIFGLAGAAILVELGLWQLRRLDQKQAILAQIQTRIAAAPVAVPRAPDPSRDDYLAVIARGRILTQEADVLTSFGEAGPGYRIISVMRLDDGRRVLVDRGFVPEDDRNVKRPAFDTEVIGNLRWPRETDSFTPPPDRKQNIWFARDVKLMAAALDTQPVLIVARRTRGEIAQITPIPVDRADLPNNHLNYALTWFSLAACWLGMTALLIWRNRKRDSTG